MDDFFYKAWANKTVAWLKKGSPSSNSELTALMLISRELSPPLVSAMRCWCCCCEFDWREHVGVMGERRDAADDGPEGEYTQSYQTLSLRNNTERYPLSSVTKMSEFVLPFTRAQWI